MPYYDHQNHFKKLFYLSQHVVYHSNPKRKISTHVKSRLKSCGACVINVNATHCLLVKQKSTQKWGFPKGSLESGESFNQCMRRELWEETGLELNRFRHQVLGRETYMKYLIYVIHMSEDVRIPFSVRDVEEIEQVEWVPLDQLASYLFNRVTECVLSKLTSKLPHTAHDTAKVSPEPLPLCNQMETLSLSSTLPQA